MRLLVIGFGVVGRSLVKLLDERRTELYREHGLSPRIVGVVDSGGAAVSEAGLNAAELLAAKEHHGSASAYAGHGIREIEVDRLIRDSDADVVIEATPSRLSSPAAAMRNLQAAMRSGRHVITVNKAPLAVGMPALLELAAYNRIQFRFSGTVGAGAPMLAVAGEGSPRGESFAIPAVLQGAA